MSDKKLPHDPQVTALDILIAILGMILLGGLIGFALLCFVPKVEGSASLDSFQLLTDQESQYSGAISLNAVFPFYAQNKAVQLPQLSFRQTDLHGYGPVKIDTFVASSPHGPVLNLVGHIVHWSIPPQITEAGIIPNPVIVAGMKSVRSRANECFQNNTMNTTNTVPNAKDGVAACEIRSQFPPTVGIDFGATLQTARPHVAIVADGPTGEFVDMCEPHTILDGEWRYRKGWHESYLTGSNKSSTLQFNADANAISVSDLAFSPFVIIRCSDGKWTSIFSASAVKVNPKSAHRARTWGPMLDGDSFGFSISPPESRDGDFAGCFFLGGHGVGSSIAMRSAWKLGHHKHRLAGWLRPSTNRVLRHPESAHATTLETSCGQSLLHRRLVVAIQSGCISHSRIGDNAPRCDGRQLCGRVLVERFRFSLRSLSSSRLLFWANRNVLDCIWMYKQPHPGNEHTRPFAYLDEHHLQTITPHRRHLCDLGGMDRQYLQRSLTIIGRLRLLAGWKGSNPLVVRVALPSLLRSVGHCHWLAVVGCEFFAYCHHSLQLKEMGEGAGLNIFAGFNSPSLRTNHNRLVALAASGPSGVTQHRPARFASSPNPASVINQRIVGSVFDNFQNQGLAFVRHLIPLCVCVSPYTYILTHRIINVKVNL